MWLASDASVQHLRFAEVRMDRPARLFLCAQCRAQVVLCSHCDHGNRYCGRPCWRLARDAARGQSASRYQRSWRGRLAHAERSRRWRQRRRERGDGGDDGGRDGGDREHNVTHQGCPPGPAAAPLVACTTHTTPAPEPARAPACTVSVAATSATPTTTTPWLCRRCARALPGWVRQGFLRHGARSLPSGSRHDHSP